MKIWPTSGRFGENCLLKLVLVCPILTQWWNKKNWVDFPFKVSRDLGKSSGHISRSLWHIRGRLCHQPVQRLCGRLHRCNTQGERFCSICLALLSVQLFAWFSFSSFLVIHGALVNELDDSTTSSLPRSLGQSQWGFSLRGLLKVAEICLVRFYNPLADFFFQVKRVRNYSTL